MRTANSSFMPLRSAVSSPQGASNFALMMPAVLCLALFWPFGGKTIRMASAKEVPAAHGVIHAKINRNGNTQVDINARALAKPSALTPPEETYVVWFQPPGHDPTNEGALKVDGNLNGDLKTETPYKDFKVFITAEKYAQLRQPEGPTVLSAQVAE
jgi:hypothetical protein